MMFALLRSRARYTMPMPPVPSTPSMRYGPKRWPTRRGWTPERDAADMSLYLGSLHPEDGRIVPFPAGRETGRVVRPSWCAIKEVGYVGNISEAGGGGHR